MVGYRDISDVIFGAIWHEVVLRRTNEKLRASYSAHTYIHRYVPLYRNLYQTQSRLGTIGTTGARLGTNRIISILWCIQIPRCVFEFHGMLALQLDQEVIQILYFLTVGRILTLW